ncbi:EamA family transporter [Halopiger goleimassiliensis]|uniref:EamA family transporter n=1 Tax=Halopiger goleimassiliensis TaxID=1293048 RepID=UPI0006777AD9|nr:EamA family transporter [Halopiger goleimassiliensis]
MVAFAIALAFATLLLFGGWVITADLATRSLTPVNAVLLSYVSSLGIVGAYVVASRRPIVGTSTDVVFALASGLFLAIGTISFYEALTRGNIAVVSAIAALYFVVPVLFGVLYFDTALSPANVAGIGLAVVAVVLIAS